MLQGICNNSLSSVVCCVSVLRTRVSPTKTDEPIVVTSLVKLAQNKLIYCRNEKLEISHCQ